MKTPFGRRDQDGAVLIMVLVMLTVMSIMVPLMVFFTQREAKWTSKQASNTYAFHLAESGIEKGYLALSISTLTWVNLQNGILINNYQFDKNYTDINGGQYAISITSGPLKQQATIIAVGRDTLKRETRSLKAIYANATLGDIAIMGGAGVDVTGNNLTVEWGAIVSPEPIDAQTGALHPSLWSSDNIINLDTSGTAFPNCDQPNCWWWHSYYAGIPPMPTLDFNFYKASAIASGLAPCGDSYYQCSTCAMSGTCASTTGKPFYIEGNWTDFDGPVVGAVIVMGNMTTPNGVMNSISVNAKLPQTAWKQYCNDWAFYLSEYEPLNPHTTQCPGIYSDYLSDETLTYTVDPVIRGLLYVGGDFTGPNGGGNTHMVYGAMVVKGTVYLNSNSHVKVFYDAETSQALQTTQIILSRISWRDVLYQWPSAL